MDSTTSIYFVFLFFGLSINFTVALYCLRCFGVPDSCSRPSNSESGAVSVEKCASNQYWCKSWATQYNVMMGCTETCRPSDPQTLCCQKDMCNCFGSNCYEQLLTSRPPVWFTPGQSALATTPARPQPPPAFPVATSRPPLLTTTDRFVWPPWWQSSTKKPSLSTTTSVQLYTSRLVTVEQCFECYNCGRKNPAVSSFCPPNRGNYCVTALVDFIGLRRIDRFCSDICPPRSAGFVKTRCCTKSKCNIESFNSSSLLTGIPLLLSSIYLMLFQFAN